MGNVVFGREGPAPPQIAARCALERVLAGAEEIAGRPLGLKGGLPGEVLQGCPRPGNAFWELGVVFVAEEALVCLRKKS